MIESVVHDLIGAVFTNEGSDASHVLRVHGLLFQPSLHVEVENHASASGVCHIHASPTGYHQQLILAQAYYPGLCDILVAPNGLLKRKHRL